MSLPVRWSLTVLCLVACGDADKIPLDSAAATGVGPTPSVAPTPAVPQRATLADFRQLHWLAGRWRGTMPDGKHFYEGYTLANDSTLRMHSFTDSAFRASTDSSMIQLRNGVVSNEGGRARWVATRVDSTGADFAPERGASNHFTWTRQSPTRWTATLRTADPDGRPQTVVYSLQKIAP